LVESTRPNKPQPSPPTPPELSVETLVNVIGKWHDQVNKLWTFFSAIALALLGYLLKELQHLSYNPARTLLAGGFVVFAVGNLVALFRAQSVVAAAVNHLRQFDKNKESQFYKTMQCFSATPAWVVCCFQAVLVLVVVLAMLAM
jgi:hypothetical protein